MSEIVQLGGISIAVTRKNIKNVHLTGHPPDGRVTLVAPMNTRLEVARAYAISKLSWIREQQQKLESQARETPRQFIERESHYVWGRRYLMSIDYQDVKPFVVLSNKRINLVIRPSCSAEKRAEVIHEWHKSLLHEIVPPLIKNGSESLRSPFQAIFFSG